MIDDLSKIVKDDIIALGKDVTVLWDFVEPEPGERLIAMKVVREGVGRRFDYHFCVYLSNGSWADLPGVGAGSRYGEIGGLDDTWTIGGIIYDSKTAYFVVKG